MIQWDLLGRLSWLRAGLSVLVSVLASLHPSGSVSHAWLIPSPKSPGAFRVVGEIDNSLQPYKVYTVKLTATITEITYLKDDRDQFRRTRKNFQTGYDQHCPVCTQ